MVPLLPSALLTSLILRVGRLKVAVQVRSVAGMVKLAAQGLGPQPAKVLPTSGVAVRVTGSPGA